MPKRIDTRRKRAYRRLPVEERRRRLLELGTDLFARHSYDELSMGRIAREAGISKPLLYHYFPSKRALFAATLEQAAAEVAARTEPDPELPPAEALAGSLDGFLGWIEENPLAYRQLMRSANSVPEVRELVDGVRDATSARIAAALGVEASPGGRAAVRGWLWFMDGAVLEWLEHGDLDRPGLRELLLGTLDGALRSVGAGSLRSA
jgi:AcrR family transcriptional regulator